MCIHLLRILFRTPGLRFSQYIKSVNFFNFFSTTPIQGASYPQNEIISPSSIHQTHKGVLEQLDAKENQNQDEDPKQNFLDLITDFGVFNALSFRSITSPSFKKIVHFLNSSFSVPDRKKISRNVSNRYNKFMNEVRDNLKGATVIAGSLDIWSQNNKSFLGCTAHYIDAKTLERKNFTFSCRRIKGKHDYVNIGCSYYEVLVDFEIVDKVKYCSSDEAANMKKAFR